jgi:quercetin dioxygenase-like cupin family protein
MMNDDGLRVAVQERLGGELATSSASQIGYVISGSFEVTCEGEKKILKAGDSYLIKPDQIHGVVALEDSKLLDVFTPMREDFIR